MKKYFLVVILFSLSSCMGYIPKYYDGKTVSVPINGLEITKDVKAYVDGKPVKIVRSCYNEEAFTWCHADEASCKKNPKSSAECLPEITVERLLKDRELRLTRDGYEDQVFILKYKLTGEKWARGGAPELFKSGDKSGSVLLLPTNTYGAFSLFGEGFVGTVRGQKHAWELMFLSVSFLPLNVVVDVYNLFIGLPSTVVVNPWYDYKIENDPSEKITLWKINN